MTEKRYVSFRELPAHGVPYSRKHLLDMMKRGEFPASIQLSPNRVAWDSQKISEWIASRPIARAVAKAALAAE